MRTARELWSDEELVAATRDGDMHAYAVLWQRYYTSALMEASKRAARADASDVVSEVFTRMLRAIRNGAGPKQDFKNYLFASIRNVARTWGARSTELSLIETAHDVPTETDAADRAMAELDAERVRACFYAMKPKLREVLWCADVMDLSHADLAARLGVSVGYSAVLLQRARDHFAKLWVEAHSEFHPVSARGEHAKALGDVSALLSGTLGAAKQAKLEQHLARCADCKQQVVELREVVRQRSRVLRVSMLGSSVTAGALAAGGAAAAAAAHVVAPPLIVLGAGAMGAGVGVVGGGTSLAAKIGAGAGALVLAGGGGAALMSSLSAPPPAEYSPPPVVVSSPAPSSSAVRVTVGPVTPLDTSTSAAPPPPATSRSTSTRTTTTSAPPPTSTTAAPPPTSTSTSTAVRARVVVASLGGCAGDYCFPALSGTAEPGATIRVANVWDSVEVRADSSGRWATGPLAWAKTGHRALRVTDLGDPDSVGEEVYYNLAAPPSISTRSTDQGVEITIIGTAGQSVEVFGDSGRLGVVVLGASGRTTTPIDWPCGPGTHQVGARYVVGSQVGPTLTMSVTR